MYIKHPALENRHSPNGARPAKPKEQELNNLIIFNLINSKPTGRWDITANKQNEKVISSYLCNFKF